MSVETLAQALLEAGILDSTSVQMRVPRARTGRKLLEDIVVDGIATEPSLVSQLARALSVPRYDPKERSPEPDALALLDLRLAEELSVLPVAVRGGGALLWVAMCDPTDEATLQEVQRRSGRRVKACLIGPRELTKALQGLGDAASAAPPQGRTTLSPPAASSTRLPATLTQPPMPQAPPTQPPMPQGMPMGMPGQAGPMGYPMPGMMPNGPGMMPNGAGMMQTGPGMMPTGPGMMPNGMGLMTGQFPAYGYPGAMPGMGPMAQGLPPSMVPGPSMAPQGAGGAPRGELQRLEDELSQAKQVVKVLAQLLVERGVIDGEELKRRLRAERDRK